MKNMSRFLDDAVKFPGNHSNFPRMTSLRSRVASWNIGYLSTDIRTGHQWPCLCLLATNDCPVWGSAIGVNEMTQNPVAERRKITPAILTRDCGRLTYKLSRQVRGPNDDMDTRNDILLALLATPCKIRAWALPCSTAQSSPTQLPPQQQNAAQSHCRKVSPKLERHRRLTLDFILTIRSY
jgi:hypothetical protein